MKPPIQPTEVARLAQKFAPRVVRYDPEMPIKSYKAARETQRSIINTLRNEPNISAQQIADRIGMFRTTVRDHLSRLHASGLVTWVDEPRGQFKTPTAIWKLTQKGQAC